ncbi:MAG: tyrosine-type recombinase/integrase [Roseiflexaceae bacterium]
MRSGKRGKARRIPLPPTAVRRLRDYLRMRCPDDLPGIGSDAERASLLIARHVAQPGQPWEPGMQPVSMRKLLAGLGHAAAAKVRAQAKQEPNVTRIGELETLAKRLEETSPHRLRHGLAYRMQKSNASLTDIGRVLGHSRPAVTTVLYGKSFDEDLRESLEAASRYTRRGRRS